MSGDIVKQVLSRGYPAGLLAWLLSGSVYMYFRTMEISAMTLEVMAYTGQGASVRFYGAEMTYLEMSLLFPVSLAVALFLVLRYLRSDESFMGRAVRENPEMSLTLYVFVLISLIANAAVIVWLSAAFIGNILYYTAGEIGDTVEDDSRIIVFIVLFHILSVLNGYLLWKSQKLRQRIHPA